MCAPCVLVSSALVVRGLSRSGQPGGRCPLIGLYLCRDWSIPSPEPVQRPPPMLSRRVKPAGKPHSRDGTPARCRERMPRTWCKCTGRKRSVLARGCRAELRLNGKSGMGPGRRPGPMRDTIGAARRPGRVPRGEGLPPGNGPQGSRVLLPRGRRPCARGGAPAGAGRRRFLVCAFGLVLAGGGVGLSAGGLVSADLVYLRDRVETPPFLGIRGMATCPCVDRGQVGQDRLPDGRAREHQRQAHLKVTAGTLKPGGGHAADIVGTVMHGPASPARPARPAPHRAGLAAGHELAAPGPAGCRHRDSRTQSPRRRAAGLSGAIPADLVWPGGAPVSLALAASA
jgi:hypothetical protein